MEDHVALNIKPAEHRVFLEREFGCCAIQAAKSLRNLDIYQVRSVELSRNQCAPLHLDAFVRAKQQLEYGRRINDNQRESRSARKISVGDVLPR